MSDEQTFASRVLMVRPGAFRRDDEAARTNAFMRQSGDPADRTASAALSEFDALVDALVIAGVEVFTHEDELDLPDSVFPNNWFIWRRLGPGSVQVTLCPMMAQSRRLERRESILEAAASASGDRITEVFHLEPSEEDGKHMEGTGSLVLDRAARVAYAARSSRTDDEVVARWCERVRYTPVLFETSGSDGGPVYHTNVVMALGDGFAIVCAECIEPGARSRVVERLVEGGREIVQITPAQMGEFCGNALQLRGATGEPVLAMSSRARAAFTPAQLARMGGRTRIVDVAIPTIETVGGGSVRCMLGELF